MCKLASFVVTRERVLWHPESDSHEKIIEKFKLDDRNPDFVRVELTPIGADYLKPVKEWEYRVDQRDTPLWYNAKNAEESVRHELTKWRKRRQWFFDAMDFVATIEDTPWFGVKRKPLKTWRVFDSRAAARDAAWAAAGAAARDAAWAAAQDAAGDAARDAARDAAVDAAWAAARAAAGASAGDAARDAAWAAAGDAAWAAALLARCLVVADKLDKKYMDHAVARWNVWKYGYGLLCDIDGVLYVYRKP
jgi:hypothetical protein